MPRARKGNRNTINGKRRRSQLPTDAAQREQLERLDARRKYERTAAAVELNRRIRAEARAAEARTTRDPRDLAVIRHGQCQPRTWNEINSTQGGGMDFGPP